jgi:Fic family protein
MRTTPETATYVPPPAPVMDSALGELERAMHETGPYPLMVNIGVAHAQFETIHPFLDGNGRMGRLLITFLLCHHKILADPLLYLSIFFKQHRQDYYDRLQAIRDRGDWEGWLRFFLEGVATVATEATTTARSIVELREEMRGQLGRRLGRRAARAHRLLDGLFRSPVVSVKDVRKTTGLSQPSANKLVNDLTQMGVLQEVTGRRRNRLFMFTRYLHLFQERQNRS